MGAPETKIASDLPVWHGQPRLHLIPEEKIVSNRERRSIEKGLSEQARRALPILRSWEKTEIQIIPALAAGLASDPIQFLVFACLGTKRGQEELLGDIETTNFFRKYRKQVAGAFPD